MLKSAACYRWLLFAFSLLAAAPLFADDAPPRTVVVWVSVDGLRGDYVDKAKAPFLHQLMSESAYSKQMTPIFPSLTFPSHISECTGVLVKDHGISGNSVFDIATDDVLKFPKNAAMIESEPIWTTARRQGLRVAVGDWPVSQNQAGEFASNYFEKDFQEQSDRKRLFKMIDLWEQDSDEKPLQLILAYFAHVDEVGHKKGPNAPETIDAVEEADALLAEFFAAIRKTFDAKMRPTDQLAFLISTDHGMTECRTQARFVAMAGDAWHENIRYASGGGVCNLYMHRLGDKEARQAAADKLIEAYAKYDFCKVYRRGEVPAEWGYEHPTRTGDLVLVAKPGYTFIGGPGEPTSPVDPAKGPLGMHGYPPSECPDMLGFTLTWLSRDRLSGVDLGKVESTGLHAEIAKLLGIEPAPHALPAIALPR